MGTEGNDNRGPRIRWLLAVSAVAVMAILPFVDGLMMAGLNAVGYAVCHQLPEHSFFLNGRPMPLCARCTGLYLGFLVGLLGLALLGKTRASLLPPGSVVAVLMLSFLVMVADGFNSLAGLLGAPQLYTTTNLLRLATGMAGGTALALLLMPLFNDSLWARPDRTESVADLGELAGFAILASLAVMMVNSQHPAALYPAALASVIGVFVTISTAGAVLATGLLHRERQAATPREASRPLLVGFALASSSMAAVAAARVLLTPALGL